MRSGHNSRLYILAFDHRGSFQKKMFGFEGHPGPEQTATISNAKHLIFEGVTKAAEDGSVPGEQIGVLVDELFGGQIAKEAKASGLKLAVAVEKSSQDVFDFEYGEDFAEHILAFDPEFAKVLVRYNVDGDTEGNRKQLARLKLLADWLHEKERELLFELLVPPEPNQLEGVGGDLDRYDAELRPELMRRAIEELQDGGVEVDVWKIEGVDDRVDAEMLARQTRRGEGREDVVCILLGRGASEAKVDHWLTQAAPVDGFVGFAIGRSIWWDPLKGSLEGSIEKEEAIEQISSNFLRFINVYENAERGVLAP